MAYAYGDGFGFGNWFTDIVEAVAPPNTIVGKAVRGDVAGAAQSTVKLVGTAAAAKSVKAPAPTTPVAQPGIFSPGGFVDQNKTMLLVVAAGLGVILLTKGRR